MYYNENKTQMEIADEFQTTRFKVAKWLQLARDEQIVEIIIHSPNVRCSKIEKKLKEYFGLNHVLVLNSQNVPHQDLIKQIGVLAAEHLTKVIKKDTVVGVCWGKSIHSCISQVKPNNFLPITVVQLLGDMIKENRMVESKQLTNMLATKYNGKFKYLNLPLYINDAELREKILS